MFLVIPREKSSNYAAASGDIIDQTCKTCADRSATTNYDFCLASLQAVPVSQATNLQGLGLIAMELALANAADTVSRTKELLINGTAFDPFVLDCLEDCLGLYLGTVMTLLDSVGAFLSEHYLNAQMSLSAAMEAVATCEEGFAEKRGVSPLAKENYDLLQLCNVALCIIHLLTHVSS